MRQPDPTREIIQRTQRYWYVDGLSELAGGIVIAVLGLYYFFLSVVQPSDVRNWLMGLGLPVVVILAAIGARWAVLRLKERLTYPRTGYVGYHRPPLKRRLGLGLLAAAISAIVTYVLTLAGEFLNQNLLPAMTGVLFALLILFLGIQYGLVRFYLIAFFTIIHGFVTTWAALPDPSGSGLFFSGMGLLWIVSGAFTLAGYLRTTRPAVDVEHDE